MRHLLPAGTFFDFVVVIILHVEVIVSRSCQGRVKRAWARLIRILTAVIEDNVSQPSYSEVVGGKQALEGVKETTIRLTRPVFRA